MCFKLLRSTSCALIHLGNLLQDLHCVILHIWYFKPPPHTHTSTCFNIPVATIFFVFLCQALSKTPCSSLYLQQLFRPIIMLIQTIQANHNAGSIRIQLQPEKNNQSIHVLLLVLQYCLYCGSMTYQSYRSVSNQASWLLSIRSWVWPRSGNGSVWWPKSGRVSVW